VARRSSGSGLGIGALIVFGLLASISMKAWAVIVLVAAVGTIAYFFFRKKPEEQAPVSKPAPVAQPLVQAASRTTVNSDPKYSESDILAVKQRAEAAARVLNDSLSVANHSKEKGTRDYKLQIARERLIELKNLANRFPFLHLTNLPDVEASITSVEAETRALSYSPGYAIPQEADPKVTWDKCWVGPNREVDIAGLGSIGGMLYYGQGLASVQGSEVEPALINPKLRVVWPKNGAVDRMPYWPSYSRISETARGEYLTWLAGGRNGPDVQMGCVFLYFYGLERRVLAEKQHLESTTELLAVLAEVRRLLTIYGSNGSFFSYATHFLDCIVLFGAKDRIYKLPPPSQGTYKLLTLRHKMALGQAAADGVPLPDNWAYAWLMNDQRFWPRTPATRCADEFKKLFSELYKDSFGDGMKLPVNKTLLKPLYQAASSSFGGSRIELAGSNIPDVTVLERPFNQLKGIADRATETLQPFSRYVGKFPDRKSSGEAIALLPTPLWPVEALHSFTSWLVQLGVETAPQTATFGELVQHLPSGFPLNKNGVSTIGASLEQIGVGIEPDIRWGGPLPTEDTKTVFFSITKDDVGVKPSALYSAARLTLQLGASVAAADGNVSQDEQQHLEQSIGRWLHLSATEIARLHAHLKWLLLAPPPLTALKRQIAVLKDAQKQALAGFLITTAQSSGEVSPAEVKVLTKIYRLFGIDEKALFSQLHIAATEPVTVKSGAPTSGEFTLPAKLTRSKAGAFVLDTERIAALTADSQRVSEILASIFVEEEQQPEVVAAPEQEETLPASSIVGLDAAFSEFVRVLISRDWWTRAELEDLAADRGVMLDGAMDHINEAFLDAKESVLLEGDDPVEVNKDIVKELEAA